MKMRTYGKRGSVINFEGNSMKAGQKIGEAYTNEFCPICGGGVLPYP